MNLGLVIVLVIFVAGAGLGLYAWLGPRGRAAEPEPSPVPEQTWQASTGWTADAGEEFAGLSEAGRCDLVFAVTDLHDERSRELLLHALDDPSDAVALAAAHALAARGEQDAVDQYAQRYPGARATRILDTLALLR